MADALSLSCPQCGAAASPESRACGFCRATLATIACPGCFGLVFIGSKHCIHCGARARAPQALDGTPWKCPTGHGDLRGIALGGAEVGECTACGGIWLDETTFQHLVTDRTRDDVVPQGGATDARAKAVEPERVRYRPCPDCGRMMNRVNFAKRSGVIVDACRGHGVWCDLDELRRIVEFVRAGGMDVARRRETEALALERQRLEFARSTQPAGVQFPRPADASHGMPLPTGAIGLGLSVLFSLLND